MAIALKEGRAVVAAGRGCCRAARYSPLVTPSQAFRNAEGRSGGVWAWSTSLTGSNFIPAVLARRRSFNSSDDAIVSKNLSGIITSWNKGAERIFGYTSQEVIGRSITLIIPPDHLDEEADILARIRRGERIDHFDTVRRRKDGSLVDVAVTISPVFDAAGRIIGASKVARDVSDRQARRARASRQSRNAFVLSSKPLLSASRSSPPTAPCCR